MKFEVGDRVVVHRPKTQKERDRAPVWIMKMDKFDGKTLQINTLVRGKPMVKCGDWTYHIDWLTPACSPTDIEKCWECKEKWECLIG